MTTRIASAHAHKVVKRVHHVIHRHKTATKLCIFVGIVVVLVISHETGITFAALGLKAIELVGDVVADRVFPERWLKLDR